MARTVLAADTTYYVRTDGNDSNDGSANDAAHAFLTAQAAYEYVAGNIDCGKYAAKIKLADGTYGAGVNIFSSGVGGSATAMTGISVEGNLANPQNVIISTTSLPCFSCTFGNLRILGGFKVTSTGASGFYASGKGCINILGAIEYGSCGQYHKHANQSGCIVDAASTCKISGGAGAHVMAQKNSSAETNQPTVTIVNNPAFTFGFCCSMGASYILYNGATFSGSATGAHYNLYYGGIVDTGGSNNLPGNAGPASTQGYYI